VEISHLLSIIPIFSVKKIIGTNVKQYATFRYRHIVAISAEAKSKKVEAVMMAWLQRFAPWVAEISHATIGWLFGFSALAMLFVRLCIAMRLGRRVSLGGSKGFVFEATAPKKLMQTEIDHNHGK
jgi:hypothetical protein